MMLEVSFFLALFVYFAPGVVKRSGQEAALRKWLAALESVSQQLKGLGREGHVNTLRHQVGSTGRRQ